MNFAIKPQTDRILIRRIESPEQIGLIFVPDVAREALYEGIVLAVGPGRFSEKRVLMPMTVSVGSRVMWGKYSGTILTQDGEPLVLLREDEVILELIPDESDEPTFQQVNLFAGCGHHVTLRCAAGQTFQIPLFCKDCGSFTEVVEEIERRVD